MYPCFSVDCNSFTVSIFCDIYLLIFFYFYYIFFAVVIFSSFLKCFFFCMMAAGDVLIISTSRIVTVKLFLKESRKCEQTYCIKLAVNST